jgi:CheY-like chemotaxis protein
MSASVRERLFEPFFTTKPLGHGTGLGLSAVHGTLRNHRGTIVVHTQEGVGSSFELILPALVVRKSGTRPSHEAPSHGAQLHARVLLADDEPLVRTTLITMLTNAGCEVHAVADGEALLQALSNSVLPDVIVTDLVMPGLLSGVKLIQTLEATCPGCPLLLITGYTGEDLSEAVAGRSRHQLLRKPFVQSELIAAIARLLPEREHKASA